MGLPAPGRSLREHILGLEQRLLDPAVRKSRDELDRLLAEAFVEYTSVGVAYRKPEVIEALQGEIAQPRTISGFEAVYLADGVVLATYRLTRQATTDASAMQSLRSSVWTRAAGEWRMLFHQGTPCPTRNEEQRRASP